jgi:hypothetical protein
MSTLAKIDYYAETPRPLLCTRLDNLGIKFSRKVGRPKRKRHEVVAFIFGFGNIRADLETCLANGFVELWNERGTEQSVDAMIERHLQETGSRTSPYFAPGTPVGERMRLLIIDNVTRNGRPLTIMFADPEHAKQFEKDIAAAGIISVGDASEPAVLH